MSNFKDLWFAQMERELNEAVDRGVPFGKAYKDAADKAALDVVQQLVDLADTQRKRERGE